MKLLMITRKVDKDDGLAGFTYNWIKKLSEYLDKLYVICLEKGNYSGLPNNVEIYSLGKEKGKNRWKEFYNFQKFSKNLVPKVNGVFTHQNPEYGILIAPWCKIFRKKLIAWYAHGSITWKMFLLNFLTNKIVTSTSKGFRLKSKKLIVLHQGIDTKIFYFKEKNKDKKLTFLSVSRISETKNIHLMLDLIKEIKEKLNKKVNLKIVGLPILEKDKIYLKRLKNKVRKLNLENSVQFLGSVANYKTPILYQEADIFLNFSDTGSLDKAVLEAMSCGTIPFVSNEAFKEILKPISNLLYIEKDDLSFNNINKIIDINYNLRRQLRKYIKDNHSLNELIKKIINLFK